MMQGGNYGAQRMYGAIGWVSMSLMAGILIDRFGIPAGFYVYGVLAVLAVVPLLYLPMDAIGRPRAPNTLTPRPAAVTSFTAPSTAAAPATAEAPSTATAAATAAATRANPSAAAAAAAASASDDTAAAAAMSTADIGALPHDGLGASLPPRPLPRSLRAGEPPRINSAPAIGDAAEQGRSGERGEHFSGCYCPTGAALTERLLVAPPGVEPVVAPERLLLSMLEHAGSLEVGLGSTFWDKRPVAARSVQSRLLHMSKIHGCFQTKRCGPCECPALPLSTSAHALRQG